MLTNILRKIKNLLIKFNLFQLFFSKFYMLVNNYYHKNDIQIYKKTNSWIHKTSVGLIPNNKPIFNSEKYVRQNFEIFFEKYLPKNNDIVVEFGSGIGCETLYISNLIGNNGKIYAFEPFSDVYDFLIETIELNNLKNVIPIKKALFRDSNGIGFRSDLDQWLSGKIDLNYKNKVPSICLNDLVKEENLEKVDFCKINIEGSEKFIVENSNLFFDKCKNIAIECHDFVDGAEFKTFQLVKEFLISKDYTINNSERNKYPWDKYYVFGSKKY